MMKNPESEHRYPKIAIYLQIFVAEVTFSKKTSFMVSIQPFVFLGGVGLIHRLGGYTGFTQVFVLR